MNVRISIPLFAVQCIALAACSSYDEGITVDVVLQGSNKAQTQTVTNDLGYEVKLTRAYIAVGGIELVPCEGEEGEHDDEHTHAFDWRSLFRIGKAYAHTETTPTRLGVPGVLPLATGRNVLLPLGTILPPRGRYCAVTVNGAPADDDAIALPTEIPFVGQVLYFAGTYQREDDHALPFTTVSAVPFNRVCDMPPIVLGDDVRSATLTITLGDRLFDGVDFAAMSAEDVGRRVAQNLQAVASMTSQ